MKSKFFAASKTDVVSALTTRCSVSTTSYDGRCTSRRSSVAGSGMLLLTSVVTMSFTCSRPRPGFVSTALVAHSLDVSITHASPPPVSVPRLPAGGVPLCPYGAHGTRLASTSREAPRQNARARCPSVNGPASSLTRSGVCPHDYHSRTQRSRDRRPHRRGRGRARRRPVQGLRHGRCPGRGPRPRHRGVRPRPAHRDHGPFRVRQVHADALHGRPGRPDVRTGGHRRHRHPRPEGQGADPAATRPARLRVPGLQPGADAHRAREHHPARRHRRRQARQSHGSTRWSTPWGSGTA